jgi:hypothetical protein
MRCATAQLQCPAMGAVYADLRSHFGESEQQANRLISGCAVPCRLPSTANCPPLRPQRASFAVEHVANDILLSKAGCCCWLLLRLPTSAMQAAFYRGLPPTVPSALRFARRGLVPLNRSGLSAEHCCCCVLAPFSLPPCRLRSAASCPPTVPQRASLRVKQTSLEQRSERPLPALCRLPCSTSRASQCLPLCTQCATFHDM